MNLKKEIEKIVAFLNQKKYEEVLKECQKLIELKLANSEIYNFYGFAFQKKGIFKKSELALIKSIELNKTNFVAMNNLALTYKYIGKTKLSEELYKQCLAIKPNYLLAILNFANLKEEMNELNESIELFQKAEKLNLKFNNIYIFNKLCNLYQIIGNKKEAKKYADLIIDTNPKNPLGYVLGSKFVDHKIEKNYMAKMEELLEKQNLKDHEIVDLLFSLGNANEAIEDYETAYNYFKRGNNIRKKAVKFDIKIVQNLHKNIINFFENFNFKKNTKSTFKKKIIFICGMPRSGTSLVEHIISSHKEVEATGENNFLSKNIKENYLINFELDNNKIYKDLLNCKNFLQNEFLNYLNTNNYSCNILTDKTVQNYLWIGFIKIYFPNAKIIFTKRNPKDIFLSIYKTDFADGFMNFSYSENDIINFCKLFNEIETFWKNLFEDEIYTIKYEDLINDTTSQIKKLISYCELDWDENCLKHYNNNSPVKTASINQVRKPIYNSSINLFKNYSKFFMKAFEQID